MNYIKLFILIAIFLIVSTIVSHIRKRKAQKSRLINSFGKIPNKRNTDFKNIEVYHSFRKAYVDNSNMIDDITWDDLDMDLVYQRINSCLTSVGEEYLYDSLHDLQRDKAILLIREELMTYLDDNPEDRLDLQINLDSVGRYNYNGIVSFIYNVESKILRNSYIYRILSLPPIISIILLAFNLEIGGMALLFSSVFNVYVYYKTKSKIEMELSAIRYLSSILNSLNKIFKKQKYESVPFFDDLYKSFNVFKSLRGKLSGIAKKDYSDAGLLVEYINMTFLIDIVNYNKAANMIKQNSEEFYKLYKSIGEIDMAISVLSFRKSLSIFCQPVFHSESSVYFKDFYHPLLTEAIPNSGNVDKDSIITGSNASGKSTFIKGLAVNGILAQTIHTCAAREFKLSFSLIITSMAVRDNLAEGESYFIREIKSIKRILDKVEETRCICFVDEILRGTNTIERIAASAAVLKYLAGTDSLCLTASHDIELTQMLDDEYDNYHFREYISEEGMYFDYKLKEGPSQTRNAINLLHYMNYDEQIIEDAETLVEQYISKQSWL